MESKRKGGSPFGEFQSREWHISLANAFVSISIWREWNLDYLSSHMFFLLKIVNLLIITKNGENLKLHWFESWHTSFQCFYLFLLLYLTLSWQRPLSYRNQSINLRSKSMDWFLYNNGLRHKRVKGTLKAFDDFKNKQR